MPKKGGGTRSKRVVKTSYGRALIVRGQLRSALRVPVPAARVCLASRADRDGARLDLHGTAVTDANGRFELKLPKGSSRDVFVVHRVSAGAVVAKLEKRVPAGVRLQASRKRLSNGQRLRLRGRLARGPHPRRGVLVELQAKRGSSWQTFGTTRTRRNGSFGYVYRFTRTTVAQRYTMRARVAKQPVYPYATGASKPITAVVRP